MYISDTSDKFFLSKEAYIALGMISEPFTTIDEITGSVADANKVQLAGTNIEIKSQCDCHVWQDPPQMPDKRPFPATEENLPKLRDFHLEHLKVEQL